MNYDTSTSIRQRKDPNDTSMEGGNNFIGVLRHNRKVCRYAKKHHITEEEAIRKLYK